MNKVVLLFTNYGPYHVARLKGFHKILTRVDDLEVVGIELSRVESTYEWTTSINELNTPFHTVVKDKSWEEVSLFNLTKSLYKVLNEVEPDIIVIAGYHLPIFLMTIVYAKFRNKKLILMMATKEDDTKRYFLKEKVKSYIIKTYAAAVVGGSPQRRYLIKLGMPSEKVFSGYNVVDNSSFDRALAIPTQSPLGKPFFLSINRFVEKKNLARLLYCYHTYRKEIGSRAWDLVLIGDGELRPQIENMVISLNLSGTVHLTGFLQQHDQIPYLHHAKCFIHGSLQEQWGLVVNEAMASSLPSFVSNRCGCFEDLIIEGETGFGFDPESTDELVNLMMRASLNLIDLERIGNNAYRHIQLFSPEYFGTNLLSAIQSMFI